MAWRWTTEDGTKVPGHWTRSTGIRAYFRTQTSITFSAFPPGPIWVMVSTVSVLPSADSVPLDVPNGLPPIFTTALE